MDGGRVIMDGSPGEVTRSYIDSVRAIDEAQLKEKFRKFVGVRSMRPGWAITEVVIFNGDSGEPRTLLEAGQPTRIEIRAIAPLDAKDAGVGVQITRLDDLLVFDEVFPAQNCYLSDQSIGLEIEMTTLVLGKAIYRLDVTLETADAVCAESASIFEVFAVNLPTGGKPMLLYPITATTLPIDLQKKDV
jgi:lipopolysaccharide transport system ATP-binding protein